MAGSGFGVDITLFGDKELIRKLEKLGKANNRSRNKVIRQAVSFSMTPVNKAAKAKLVPGHGFETELLKKSIGKKSKTYKGVTFIVVVGPRSGFKKEVNVDGKLVLRNPAKYAHLVELGTRHSRAFPFLRPALLENKAVIETRLRQRLSQGLIREAKKKA